MSAEKPSMRARMSAPCANRSGAASRTELSRANGRMRACYAPPRVGARGPRRSCSRLELALQLQQLPEVPRIVVGDQQQLVQPADLGVGDLGEQVDSAVARDAQATAQVREKRARAAVP